MTDQWTMRVRGGVVGALIWAGIVGWAPTVSPATPEIQDVKSESMTRRLPFPTVEALAATHVEDGSAMIQCATGMLVLSNYHTDATESRSIYRSFTRPDPRTVRWVIVHYEAQVAGTPPSWVWWMMADSSGSLVIAQQGPWRGTETGPTPCAWLGDETTP